MEYTYTIHLDERGEFFATVDDADGQEVFRIADENGYPIAEMIEDGWMAHTTDTDGLAEYLADLGIIGPDDSIN
jgi:hypothetical protein